jgi:hypothetical protein
MNDNQTFKSPLWEVQTGRIPSVISVAQLTNKIKQDTMARDFALGYAVILTEALQQIETEERAAAEQEAVSLVEKVRQNLAEGSMEIAQS